MSIWRNSLINVTRLKDKYIFLAIISFVGSALILAALMTINSTAKLNKMLDLPYENFYQAIPLSNELADSNETIYLNAWGYSAETFLKAHTAIETIYITKTYTKEIAIAPINTQNVISERESGKFPVFVMPNSAYDNSFRKGERILVSGRHITPSDSTSFVLLLDERLATENHLSTGDNVVMSGDTGDVTFTVVGIYKTLKMQREVSSSQDMLCNAIIASSVPDENGQNPSQMYDLYIKFAPHTDIPGFLNYMDSFPNIYSPTSAGFQFVSVNEINATYNQGVNTLFSISSFLLVALVVTIICSTIAFCRVLISYRRHEILIMRALNAPPSRIIRQFLIETVYVYAPFSVIGSIISAFVCRSIIGQLLVYFSSMVTPENLRNTSSYYIENINNIRLSTIENLPLNTLIPLCIVTFLILVLITVCCITLQLAVIIREKPMALLREGRR